MPQKTSNKKTIKPPLSMNPLIKNSIVFLIVLFLMGSFFSLYTSSQIPKKEQVGIETLIEDIAQEKIEKIQVHGDTVTVFLKDKNAPLHVVHKEPAESLSTLLKNYSVDTEILKRTRIEVSDSRGAYWLNTFVTLVLPFLIIAFFIWLMIRQVQGASTRALSFGMSRARQYDKESKVKVTFADVAGAKEAKEELQEIIEFLKSPQKFTDIGARVPKGVLLVGPPGSGKTLLAKAAAGEADVPFFLVSGSEFIEMFVGVGASVSGDTPVLIRTETETKLMPIGTFVDAYYEEGESDRVKYISGVQTVGMRKKETRFWGSKSKEKMFFGASKWTSVQGVYRHHAKELYTVTYLGGSIKTTGDHSIFIRKGNMICAKRADEIQKGDILVNLPFKVRGEFQAGIGTAHHIRAHEFTNKNTPLYLDLFDEQYKKEKYKYDYAHAHAGTYTQASIAATVGVSQATIGNWQRRVHQPQFFLSNVLREGAQSRIRATPDLLRLIGYYVAEGRTEKYYTQFVFGGHEKELHKDCADLIRSIFTLTPFEKSIPETNSYRITISSAPVARFFEKHCGTGSHRKHIPEFLWDLPREYFVAFLDGYAKGDGYQNKDGKRIMCSVSHQLIREVAWLANMHGIPVGVGKTVSHAGRKIGATGKPLPETVAWRLIIGKSADPLAVYNGPAAQLKKPIVLSVEKQAYDGYVYDLCGCENEAFFGGEKPVLLHNSRVRDLFQRAKKNAPCIIFIDEIDAVGRQRGAGLGGSHDEREQTLNQILVELDGFEPSANLVVLAATNRPDVLDPALLRPGRFDRRVVIDLPSLVDREAILQVHAKNKPLAADVALRRVAERTPGFSGADLANVMNEAAILAARHNAKEIKLDDLFQSIEKVILGPERKGHIISEKEKKITAYHEGGHALVSHTLPDAPPVQKISVISRGQAAGYTLNLPTEDKHFHTRSEFTSELAVLLGGYVAEKMIFGEVTTGASNDLKKATRLARRLIMQYGMSEGLGQRTYGEREELIFLGREITEQRDYSEKTAERIDEEIFLLIENAAKTAKKILTTLHESLEKLVEILLEKETIERDEFETLFGKK